MFDAAYISQRNMRDWYLARVDAAGGSVVKRPGVSWGHVSEGLSPSGAGTVIPFPENYDPDVFREELAAIDKVGGVPWSTVGSALGPKNSFDLLKEFGFAYQFAGVCMVLNVPLEPDERNDRLPAGFDLRFPRKVRLADDTIHPSYGGMSEPSAIASLRAANVLAKQSTERYELLGVYDGETMAASAALFVTDSSIGLYDVASLPSYRRRGLAGALVQAALNQAQQLYPKRPIVLQCDASLVRFYARYGFETCGWIAHWSRAGDAQTQAGDRHPALSDIETLSVAIETGDLDLCGKVLEQKPYLVAEKLVGSGASPLHLAAYRGMQQEADMLISAGADIGQRDGRYGASPLYWALIGLSGQGPVFKMAQLNVARSLVRAGAELGDGEKALIETLDPNVSRELVAEREGKS